MVNSILIKIAVILTALLLVCFVLNTFTENRNKYYILIGAKYEIIILQWYQHRVYIYSTLIPENNVYIVCKLVYKNIVRKWKKAIYTWFEVCNHILGCYIQEILSMINTQMQFDYMHIRILSDTPWISRILSLKSVLFF